MKTALCILAHEAAQPTVDLFLPHWRQLDCALYCSVPADHHVRGFDSVMNYGKSAYSGREVFRRFALTLEAVIATGADQIIIAEYDTVNLSPELPRITPGCVMSCFVQAGYFLCALSPWAMDAATAERLLDACHDGEQDGDFIAGQGLLDRWLGHIIQRAGIPFRTASECLGYPWHEGAHDRIRRVGYTWVHGWKTKEEFGGLI